MRSSRSCRSSRSSRINDLTRVFPARPLFNLSSVLAVHRLPSCHSLTHHEFTGPGRSNRSRRWRRAKSSPFALTARSGFMPEAIGESCPTSATHVTTDSKQWSRIHDSRTLSANSRTPRTPATPRTPPLMPDSYDQIRGAPVNLIAETEC
jgi:hypothetical protein